MMPEVVRWPRDADGAPLHFLAQIACADLPKGLWNGFGPRRGWLLLFVETLKMEDYAERGNVQILHVNRLGPERTPPKDMPTVRHTMSDYIDCNRPNTRKGVPPLWRKWPLDLLELRYDQVNSKDEALEAPFVDAKDLYGAPVSDRGIWGDLSDLGIERPLTWRGALYFIEDLSRSSKPEEYKRRWKGNRGGLLSAPNLKWIDFGDVERHLEAVQNSPAWLEGGPRVKAAQAALREQIRSEREEDWLKKALLALAAKRIDLEKGLEKSRRELTDARGLIQDKKALSKAKLDAKYRINLLREAEKHRKHLHALAEVYPGSAGLRRLNAEIEQAGKLHLAWAAKQHEKMQSWLDYIYKQDLDSELPEDEWNRIISDFKNVSSPFWRNTYNGGVLEKTEASISTKSHLQMAIREDLLDLYANGKLPTTLLNDEQLELLEQKLRYIEPGLPHRMGGQANSIHNNAQGSNEVLLFQIATDKAMGWMWGDVGGLYVTMSKTNLLLKRFKRLDAVITGH